MIKAIINGLFKLILNFFNLLLSPITSLIVSIFPEVGTFFNYIMAFLNYAFSYVGLALDLFFIPRPALTLLFDYWIILYSIYIGTMAVRFAINIYNKFKI